MSSFEYTSEILKAQPNISLNQSTHNDMELHWPENNWQSNEWRRNSDSNIQLVATTLFNGSNANVNSDLETEEQSQLTNGLQDHELNIPYTVFEILVAICAVFGNLMVIIVFQRERKLRRRTNYYIVSLAIADLLVGCLGIPFAILASVGLPTNLYACLFTVSLLVVLCTISIFCLVAVSVDRYWAILYPMAYSRNVRTRTTIVIIGLCWLAGSIVGFLPLLGWHAAHNNPHHTCLFVEVMDYNYLVFLYFATIVTPAILMLAFYAHIYQVIIKQVRQIVTMNPVRSSTYPKQRNELNRRSPPPTQPVNHGGTMLRVLGAARKREIKATQNLSIIVLFFMICWLPLYTINCIQAFCNTCDIHPKLTLLCIILTHLNSAVNPILYAYHLKDFRLALKNFVLGLLGFEVTQPLDIMHRYSMASQHRLPPRALSTRNISNRIYLDSPIWLREQREKNTRIPVLLEDYGVGIVTPCLNTINKTAVAVVAVKTATDSMEVDGIQDDKVTQSNCSENILHQSFTDLTTNASKFDVILLPNKNPSKQEQSEEIARDFRRPHWPKQQRHSYSDCDLYCMKSLENSTVPLTPQFLTEKKHSNQSIFIIRNNFQSISPTRFIRKSSKAFDDPLSMRNVTIDGCRI